MIDNSIQYGVIQRKRNGLLKPCSRNNISLYLLKNSIINFKTFSRNSFKKNWECKLMLYNWQVALSAVDTFYTVVQ